MSSVENLNAFLDMNIHVSLYQTLPTSNGNERLKTSTLLVSDFDSPVFT